MKIELQKIPKDDPAAMQNEKLSDYHADLKKRLAKAVADNDATYAVVVALQQKKKDCEAVMLARF